MRTILITTTFLLFALTGFTYDRCDDLCRVLGFSEGGSCSDDEYCLCAPADFDVTTYLPGVCKP